MTDQNANVVISADTSGYSQSVNQATQQTNQLVAAVDNLSSHLDGLTKRAGKRLILFGAADLAALTGAVAIAAKLDDQTRSLQASLTGTTKSLTQYTTSIDKMARSMPVARGEIAQMVTMLDKMGVQSADAVGKMSDTFLKLGAATSESAQGLAQSMIQLNKQMNTLSSGSSAITGFSNSLLSVSKAAGVSAQGILDFSQNLAPIARSAGMTQQQLMGVSAAFTSAGQDGFAAANAFNSMLTDITRSIRDGSPDITKYSNLLGVTVEQFKQMSASDQMVGLFEAINKQGPNAIRILDQLGIDGVRASKAIQGAVQTGSLRSMINTATSSYNPNGGGAVDQSAEAAWGGMNSALQSMQNQFQQIGQAIGSSLVGPATQALGVFNAMLGTVNNIAHPILAMGGVLAGIVGGTALGGGAAMSTLSTFGQIAMAGYALRSRPARALLGGFRGGMAEKGGYAPGAIGAAQEELYTAGRMPRWQEQMYLAARGFGGALGDPNRGGQNFLGRAASAPFRLIGWGARASSQFYDDSMTNGENRALPFSKNLVADARVSGATADANREIRKYAKDQMSQVGRGLITEAEAAENIRYQKALAKAAVTAAGSLEQVTGAAREAAGAMATAAGKNIRAGFSNAGSLIGSGAKGLAGMLGGPMLGITAAMTGYQWYRGAQDAQAAGVPEAAQNPISEYNAALGTSTDKLTNFNAIVQKSAKQFDTVNGALNDFGNAAKLAASSGKYTSSVAGALTSSDSAGGVAFLRSVGGQLTPQNTPSVMADLIRKYGPQQAQQIFAAYQANGQYGQNDIMSTLRSTQNAQDTSPWGVLSSAKSGFVSDNANILAGTISGNINTAASAVGAGNQARGQQVYGSLTMSSLADIISQNASGKLDNPGATRAVGGMEKDIFGGSIGANFDAANAAFSTSWAKAAADYVGKDVKDVTPEDAKKWLKDKAIGDNKVLKDWYDSQVAQGVDPFMTTSKAYVSNPNKLSASQQAIGATSLGGFAQSTSGIQYALNEGYGSNKAQNRAVNLLQGQAMAIGGGDQAKTVVAFDQLITAVNQSSDRLSQLATAAYQAYQGLVALQRGNMSPAKAAIAGIRSDTALINQPTSESNTANQQSALQSRAQSLAGIRDYYQQYASVMYSYQKQMGRSSYDFYKVTLPRMELAYHKQSLYAQQDFAKSMKRAAESAAQSVYDPWQRVYSQLTAGAGNEIDNLKEQNTLLIQQRANLNKAHKMGVSQQTIDTLDLTNPNNAQQLQSVIDDLVNNPQFVAQLNKQTAIRGAATKALTQNKDNMSFRNASEDFAINQGRAADAYSLSVKQMTDDYHRMMGRAKDDMIDYGKNFNDTFKGINATVHKMMTDMGLTNDFVKNIDTEIAKNADIWRLLTSSDFGTLDPTGQGKTTIGTHGEHSGQGVGASQISTPSRPTGAVQYSMPNIMSSKIQSITIYDMNHSTVMASDPKAMEAALQQQARKAALTKVSRIK